MRIPECGIIITQATAIGLMPNGDAANVNITAARVYDEINVERYNGTRLPGKVQGMSTLEVDMTCDGAVAMSIVLIGTPRQGAVELDGSADVQTERRD